MKLIVALSHNELSSIFINYADAKQSALEIRSNVFSSWQSQIVMQVTLLLATDNCTVANGRSCCFSQIRIQGWLGFMWQALRLLHKIHKPLTCREI